jgi:hypothetical protein
MVIACSPTNLCFANKLFTLKQSQSASHSRRSPPRLPPPTPYQRRIPLATNAQPPTCSSSLPQKLRDSLHRKRREARPSCTPGSEADLNVGTPTPATPCTGRTLQLHNFLAIRPPVAGFSIHYKEDALGRCAMEPLTADAVNFLVFFCQMWRWRVKGSRMLACCDLCQCVTYELQKRHALLLPREVHRNCKSLKSVAYISMERTGGYRSSSLPQHGRSRIGIGVLRIYVQLITLF